MPHSACLTCLVTSSTIGSPLGNLDQPIGCCQACHSLVCGHHGQRDPNKPAFLCLLCVPALAVAAASTAVPPVTETLEDLRSFYELNSDFIPFDWLESEEPSALKRWLRQGDQSRFDRCRLIIKEGEVDDVRRSLFLLRVNPRSRRLIEFAAFLIRQHEIPANHLPRVVLVIVEYVDLDFE